MVAPITIEELQEYERTANAFQLYREKAMEEYVTYRCERIATLPEEDQKVYRRLLPHLNKVAECIDLNAELLNDLGEFGHCFASDSGSPPELKHSTECVPEDDAHGTRVHSTLRQIAREWSLAGKKERDESFGVICSELNERFPPEARTNIKVYVPGSGLGRLSFDIAMLGFFCTGNEYNMYMLFTGYFIQNFLKRVDCLEIAPYVHNFSGNRQAADQLQRISFPDIAPIDLLQGPGSVRQSMGDFFESVEEHEEQDVVATCFFLDALADVYKGIKAITKLTKKGGLWINFGPILWHYEHVRGDDTDSRRGGLEMDFETMMELIKEQGWEIEKQSTHKTTYCQNQTEMLANQYTCEFFVAKKL